jgi:hypothetical protein
MVYWNHIKKKYFLYLISGVLMGLTAFTLVFAYRYDNYLTARIDKLEKISRNRHKIEKQIMETDSVVTRFRNDFNLDTNNFDADAYLLHALDEMKVRLKGASLRVGEINKNSGKKAVSVEIDMPQKDYSRLVSSVQYIESFRIPQFKIEQFSIVKGDGRKINLRIQGMFLMPQL